MEREFYKTTGLLKTLTYWRSAQSLIKCSLVSLPCKYRNNRQASRTCLTLSKTTLACLILKCCERPVSSKTLFWGLLCILCAGKAIYTLRVMERPNLKISVFIDIRHFFVRHIGNKICQSSPLLSPSHLPRAHNPSASLLDN